jgi:hypothetical protein
MPFYVNYDKGGAVFPANTMSSIISSCSVRLYVRIVSPNSEISYIRNLRSNLLQSYQLGLKAWTDNPLTQLFHTQNRT